jgi:filamin
MFSATPKHEAYSSKYESKKLSSNSSPVNDFYKDSEMIPKRRDQREDTVNSSNKTYSQNYSFSSLRRDTRSPNSSQAYVRDVSSSPISRNSPTVFNSTQNYETKRHLTASPRSFLSSPRNTNSPINYSTTTIHKVSSPTHVNNPNSDSYKIFKETSTYKNHSVKSSPVFEQRPINNPSEDCIDYTSNIKVNTTKLSTPSRRDSWDVINKTKHLLSHNSLESLANLTRTQLNTDLSYVRAKDVDQETERNTQYNKYNSLTVDPKTIKYDADTEIKSYKYFTDSKISSNVATSMEEKNEKITSKQKDSSYMFGTTSNFRTIDDNSIGSQAIRVQNIPDGVTGRSVQFESKIRHSIFLFIYYSYFFPQLMDQKLDQET